MHHDSGDTVDEFEADGMEHETPQTSGPASNESVIASGATFEGHFKAPNGLRIAGTVSGTIDCRGTLIIEEDATSRARIVAKDCDVHGAVNADLSCTGRVRLASTAVVHAAVRARSLVVDEGASITGFLVASKTAPFAPPIQPELRAASTSTGREIAEALEDLRAYCMRCRGKQLITDRQEVTLRNGRPAIEGKCGSCGTRVFRMVSGKT